MLSFLKGKKEHHGLMKILTKYIRIFCASDDEVFKAIMGAVPARRQLIIQACIQKNRFSVIEKVVPALQSLPNYPINNIAQIIHAWYVVFLCFAILVCSFVNN
jgi:hypothetical protein